VVDRLRLHRFGRRRSLNLRAKCGAAIAAAPVIKMTYLEALAHVIVLGERGVNTVESVLAESESANAATSPSNSRWLGPY